MNTTIKKTVAAALSFAFITSSVTMLSTSSAYASANADNINVGPSVLTSSVYDGTKVYYGNYNGSPVIYNVLNADDSSALLNSETTLFDMAFSSNNKNPEQPAKNAWPGSDIQKLLNGDTFYLNTDVFSPTEQSAIMSTEHQAETYTTVSSHKDYAATDNIFLLSVKEADTYYGSDDASKVKTDENGDPTAWWLRTSPNSVTSGAMGRAIWTDGSLTSRSLTTANTGVSPAFNIDLSNVAFVTSPSADKENFSAVTDDSSTDTWELTFTASDSTMDATASIKDSKITVEHKAASEVLENATQVSCAIFDKNNNLLYYGAINTDENATSSVFELPDGIDEKNISLYVFAEDVNDGLGSDYISSLGDPVTLDVISDNASDQANDNSYIADTSDDSAVNNNDGTINDNTDSDDTAKTSGDDPVKTSDDFAMAVVLSMLLIGGAGCALSLKKKSYK